MSVCGLKDTMPEVLSAAGHDAPAGTSPSPVDVASSHAGRHPQAYMSMSRIGMLFPRNNPSPDTHTCTWWRPLNHL